MGLVYKAEQLPLGREVAIKILESKHVPDIDDTFRQRFFLEAAAAAKLHHPNTIVVYDYGQADDGLFYIAMEYISGTTLERRLKKQGPLTPAQAVHVGLQICSSLRDAHEQGLVHRDLKPGNIMFAPRAGDSYFIKVLDFGLVKVVSGDDKDAAGLTQSGVVMGSPRYMAPEQVRTLPVDHRTDIYSFGATLYHTVAGAPPFATGKAFDAMTAHVTTAPPSLKATWPDCPVGPKLEAVIMRCLEKNPDNRFQSMEELMQELHGCVEEAGAFASGSNYLSHVSLPGLQLAAEKGDSNPSFSSPISRSTWSGSDSAPALSGAHPVRREPAGEDEIGTVAEQMPVPPKRSGLRWVAVGAVVAVGLAVGITIALLPGDEDPPVAPPQVAHAPINPAPAPAPAPTPTSAPVQVRSVPPGATVRHEGSDLGDTPVAVPVPPGESWVVELTHQGFQPRRVTLLAGQPEITVHLRPVEAPPAADEDDANDQGPANRRRRWQPPRHSQTTTSETPQQAEPQHHEQHEEHGNGDLHDPWSQ